MCCASIRYAWIQALRLVWPATFYLACIYIDACSQLLTDIYRLVPDDHDSSMEILPDLGFSMLGYIDAPSAPSIVVNFAVLFTLIYMLRTPHFIVVTRRFFFIHGILFLMRAVSVALTRYPSPAPHCSPVAFTTNLFVTAAIIMSGTLHTCSDCMFSGHAACLTLLALFIINYTNPSRLTRFVVYAYGAVGCLLLIVTHFHYSVDVFIGVVVAYGGYTLTHILIATHHYESQARINAAGGAAKGAFYLQVPSHVATAPPTRAKPKRGGGLEATPLVRGGGRPLAPPSPSEFVVGVVTDATAVDPFHVSVAPCDGVALAFDDDDSACAHTEADSASNDDPAGRCLPDMCARRDTAAAAVVLVPSALCGDCRGPFLRAMMWAIALLEST